jgi:hypothetical protein
MFGLSVCRLTLGMSACWGKPDQGMALFDFRK